jgi:prefoldin subunit 5
VLAKKSAERDADAFLPDQKEQIAALKSEIERLRDSIQQIASGTTQIASAEFKELSAMAEEKLKQNVFVSVGVAAFIGYLWGRSGR